MLGRMGDGEVNAVGTAPVEELFRFAGDRERGNSVFVVEYLDVLPGDLTAPSCLEGLQKRFFCGKSGRITLKSGGSLAVAVFAFDGSKNAFGKTRSSFHRFAYAINFNNVDAGRNDHN